MEGLTVVDFRLGDGGYAGTDRKVSVDEPWIGNRPRQADEHGYAGMSESTPARATVCSISCIMDYGLDVAAGSAGADDLAQSR